MNPPSTVLPWGAYAPSSWLFYCLKGLHALPNNSACRRIALWLRKPVKGMLAEWVDIEIWGLRLRLRARGNLSEQRLILMPQYLDSLERYEIAKAMAGGGVFLDIGANAGVYSLWVASLRLPSIRVEAFEPDPELCAALRFNMHTNGLDVVRLNPIALGRHQGSMHLISGAGNKGENQVTTEGGEGATSIEMTTLPRFLEHSDIQRIEALKIDIEGHEVEALEPFFRDCPASLWPRLLICEWVHDPKHQLSHLLDQAGYRLKAKGRLNGIYTREAQI